MTKNMGFLIAFVVLGIFAMVDSSAAVEKLTDMEMRAIKGAAEADKICYRVWCPDYDDITCSAYNGKCISQVQYRVWGCRGPVTGYYCTKVWGNLAAACANRAIYSPITTGPNAGTCTNQCTNANFETSYDVGENQAVNCVTSGDPGEPA